MARLHRHGASLVCALAVAAPLSAQGADRIWGRVETTEGAVHEGFLRWDRNEGSWFDILDGSKEIPEENYVAWLAANDGERAIRVIELAGHRISWEEEHPDFPRLVTSGVRFGHLASLRVVGRDRIELTLRSGQVVELEGGASDIGPSLRRLVVDAPGGRQTSLRWRQLDRVVFSPPPSSARPAAARIHGTVQDELGRAFTGYVAWDTDEILEADVLDGEEMRGGEEHRIPFRDIVSIEKIPRGSRVALRDGRTLDLTDSNDVDDHNRGIQISDPGLGLVDVPWEEFRLASFHAPGGVTGYEAFDGGRPLRGTVTTQSGERVDGMIRWDADEAATWELLNGRSGDVAFAVELGRVRRVERGEAFGTTVTLFDGRSFELEGSNDVDWDNKGIMVALEHAEPSDASVWRVVAWDDFREVEFR